MHADVVNDEDVWMVECAGSTSLLLESPKSIFIDCETRWDDFDSDVAAQLRIARAIHFTHPASTKLRADFVTSELCA